MGWQLVGRQMAMAATTLLHSDGRRCSICPGMSSLIYMHFALRSAHARVFMNFRMFVFRVPVFVFVYWLFMNTIKHVAHAQCTCIHCIFHATSFLSCRRHF